MVDDRPLDYKEVQFENLKATPTNLDALKVDMQDPLEEFNLVRPIRGLFM